MCKFCTLKSDKQKSVFTGAVQASTLQTLLPTAVLKYLYSRSIQIASCSNPTHHTHGALQPCSTVPSPRHQFWTGLSCATYMSVSWRCNSIVFKRTHYPVTQIWQQSITQSLWWRKTHQMVKTSASPTNLQGIPIKGLLQHKTFAVWVSVCSVLNCGRDRKSNLFLLFSHSVLFSNFILISFYCLKWQDLNVSLGKIIYGALELSIWWEIDWAE